MSVAGKELNLLLEISENAPLEAGYAKRICIRKGNMQLSEESQYRIHWMWKETKNRLETLKERADEGRDINSAVEFARYILWSGLIKIFEECPGSGPLRVDAALIRKQATELEQVCTEHYRTRGSEPGIKVSELRSLHEKMDLLAGYVARLGLP